MSDQIVELDYDNFEDEVTNSDIPVLVDFWAEWCAPCKTIAPILEDLAEKYEGDIKVGKVDIDANSHLANDHQIRAVPTLIFFHQGNVLRRVTGTASKKDLDALFSQMIDVSQEEV